MRTRIPKLIAEINTITADHSNCNVAEEQEAIELLKRTRHTLGLARVKLQESDVKKNPVASGRVNPPPEEPKSPGQRPPD